MPNIGMVTTPLKELNPRNELPLESENPLPRWLREAHLRWRPTDAILLAPSLQPRTLHVYTCSRLLKYPKVASYAGRLVDLGPEAALTAPEVPRFQHLSGKLPRACVKCTRRRRSLESQGPRKSS